MSANESPGRVPELIVLLRRVAWHRSNLQRRLFRFENRRQGCTPPQDYESESNIEQLRSNLELCDYLMEDIIGWINERTGLNKPLLNEVAVNTAFNQPSYDKVFAALRSLDEDPNSPVAVLWSHIWESYGSDIDWLTTDAPQPAQVGVNLSHAQPVVRGTRTATPQQNRRTTKEEAQSELERLGNADPYFKNLTCGEMATAVSRSLGKTCSESTIHKTEFWKRSVSATGRARRRDVKAIPAEEDRELHQLSTLHDVTETLVADEEETLREALMKIKQLPLDEEEKIEIAKMMNSGECSIAKGLEIAREAASGRGGRRRQTSAIRE